jgi:8-oxo-dGTP pyrophosphatase MutT (NUDIX family)
MTAPIRQHEHACAVIEDHRGHLLLELRPTTARFAAGRLTCFGGKRDAGESLEHCLRRELREELGWAPDQAPAIACDLWLPDQFVARFYRCHWPTGRQPRCLPGVVPLWCPWRTLPGLPLSPWHAAVLTAVQRGEQRVVAG